MKVAVSKAYNKQRRIIPVFMKKLVLKNLKGTQLSRDQLKNIYGGNCSASYCEFVNSSAACCNTPVDPPDPPNDPDPPYTICGHYYCMHVAPWASCCL